MKILADKLTNKLINSGADEDSREVYTYALEVLLSMVITLSVIVIVGAVTGRFLVSVVWTAFFLPIRHTAGGAHAPNRLACTIYSLAIGIGCQFLATLFYYPDWTIYGSVAVGLAIVLIFAPVIHKNHPMSEGKVAQMKKISRTIVVIESIILITITLLWDSNLIYAAAFGMLSATVSTLIGKILNAR